MERGFGPGFDPRRLHHCHALAEFVYEACPLTGMSGTGKSTVIQELQRRGYKAIDTDWDPEWEEPPPAPSRRPRLVVA